MELVHKKTYYHIQREKIWNTGEEHFVGNEKNRYCSFFDFYGQNYQDTNSGALFSPIEVADYILNYLETGEKNAETARTFSYDTIAVVRLLRDIISNYTRYMRETTFEEVRREFFPSYPSRQKGLWVISDEKYVPYWYKTLGMNCNSVIFELELTGKIHEANHASIRLTTNSINFIRNQAFKYWIGDDIVVNKEIGYECIFEGFVFVKKVIPLETFWQNSIKKTNGQFEVSANILKNFLDLQKWMKLRLSKELFSPDRVYSPHGIAHTTRVLFGTVLLTHYVRDISEDIKRAVYYSAIIHDLGRTNDDKDYVHGANSAELYRSRIEEFIPDINLQAQILNAVKYHSLDDSLCPQEEQSIIWKILKDADALDRGRFFPQTCDKSFLRLDIFKTETGDNVINFINGLSVYSEDLTWNNPYDELVKCITKNSDNLNVKII